MEWSWYIRYVGSQVSIVIAAYWIMRVWGVMK